MFRQVHPAGKKNPRHVSVTKQGGERREPGRKKDARKDPSKGQFFRKLKSECRLQGLQKGVTNASVF